MDTTSFCITPQMIQLFHECVEKKNYEEFYNHYKCDLEVLSEKLKTVDLPKNSMPKYYAHNFMDCFELLLNPNRQPVGDSSIAPFRRKIENAVNNKDWGIFYWGNRYLADFVIRKARNQQKIDIYVFDGVKEYLTFYDRDCDAARKNTELYLSNNNGVKLVRPSIHEKNAKIKKVFATSSPSSNYHYMTHHKEPVHFTSLIASHQRPYAHFSSSRYVPMNQSYRNSRSIHLHSLQNPRKSEICEGSLKHVLDQIIPPNSLTSNFLLNNKKNSKEAKVDSLNSWSIVSFPRVDMDTLKYFELDNTLRQSSKEMDISDVPVPEFEQPQRLMFGDLWSDLDKPEPSKKSALCSDSSADRGLEHLERYAKDAKQHNTNSVIDSDPLKKVSGKEYSEDEDENATMNRNFQRKFQEKTEYERTQDELKRKKEERADRRRKLEEELRKLDLEDKEELVMVSNIKTPKQESPPISPPPLNHDVIENVPLKYVLQNTLRSTDTKSSEEPGDQEVKAIDEDNFTMLLQKQNAQHQEKMGKIKKKRAVQKKELDQHYERKVEHKPTVNTENLKTGSLENWNALVQEEKQNTVNAPRNTDSLYTEISGQKPAGKENIFTEKDLMLKNVDQEGNEKLSTDNMKTEQIAAGESSERLPIFSKLLSDLDPIAAPLPKSEKTPCLEDLQLYMENIVKQTTESMADVTAAEELIKNDLKNAETSESKLPASEQHDSEGEEKEAQERLNRSVQTQSIRNQKELELKRKEWADRKKKLEKDTDSIRKGIQERLVSFLNGQKQ